MYQSPWKRCFGLLAGVIPCGLAAQEVPSLKELLDTRVAVATQVAMSARETPGVVTVIRREELRSLGARDLLEALRMVPGIDFGSDTNGVVGIGVRSSWGHDGKVLLLIDGLEMNEPLYGTLQFGLHYPIGNVDRIEIIRGPGSVRFGGYAELAVINVITRSGAEVDGVSGDLWLGTMPGADTRRAQGQVAFGKAWGSQDLALSYARGQAPMGVGPFRTGGGEVPFGDRARNVQDFLSLSYGFGAFKVRYLRDAFQVGDDTREFKPTFAWMSFPSEFLGLEYTWTTGAWTLAPRASLKHQSPWNYTDSRTDRNTRGVVGLTATWAAQTDVSLSVGAEATQDNANIFWSSRGVRETYVYEYRAALAQLQWTTAAGHLDLGVRYDDSNHYPSATSPRLAFTRATEDWHFKILAAGAFRAPSTENLFVNPDLRPERTTTYEAEVGRRLAVGTYLSANLFFLRIHDPISYANPSPGVNTYLNFEYTGATGVEVVLRNQGERLTVDAALAYARAQDRDADFYRVEGQSGYHVGFPQLKFTSQAQWRFAERWSFNPSLMVLGPRYAYAYGEPAPSRLSPAAFLNLFLTWAPSSRVQAGLALTNATDQRQTYPQPYGIPGTGGNPPMPGAGREISVRVSFHD